MSLLAAVATLDGLDETTAKLYKADGERFVLDVQPVDGFVLENVTGLKSTVTNLRGQLDEANKLNKAWDAIDKTPAEAQEALTKVESMKDWTPEERVAEQIEAKTKEVASSKQAEIDALNVRFGITMASLEAATVKQALIDAATKANFVSPTLAPKLFRDSVKLQEKDGVFTAIVVNNQGEQRTSVQANGDIKAVSIEDYIAEQAKLPEYLPLIQGNPASGTGNPTQLPSTNPNTNAQLSRGESEGQALNDLSNILGR